MKYLKFLLILILISCKCQNVKEQGNLERIALSYIEYKQSVGNFDKQKDIIIAGANSIDENTYWMDIAFDSVYNLYDVKYENLYELNGFKTIVFGELNKSYLIAKQLNKIPYENINKGVQDINYEVSTWHLELNNRNEVLLIKSKYPIKDIMPFLKKNKVIFSKEFKQDN